jgi:glycosyltransferase involved in cell wall biosynthesis
MKICLVGPGYMPIPPTGWGACEILIWDYYQTLTKKGHTVKIVNTPDVNQIYREIDEFAPDLVHIQYDDYFYLAENLQYKTIITSHYAYIEQPQKHGGYSDIFKGFLKSKATIFALSEGIKQTYVKHGRDPNTVRVVKNGVRTDLFRFKEVGNDKSIYLAKIDYRKRQYLFQDIKDLYFIGNFADTRFNSPNYIGEWTKDQVYKNLTVFGNLVLLSDGEAHPLVCLEAMSAGLGLVVSEYATANLDLTLPFINVIEEKDISNLDIVEKVIIENRKKSLKLRQEIREYSKTFDWEVVVDSYLQETSGIV